MSNRSERRRIVGSLVVAAALPLAGYLLDYQPVFAAPVDDVPSTIGTAVPYPDTVVSYSSNAGTAYATGTLILPPSIDW